MEKGYEIYLFPNTSDVEFSKELGSLDSEKGDKMESKALNYIKNKFPNVKVKAVKVTASAIVITTIGFSGLMPSQTEAAASGNTVQAQTSANTTYRVVAGDNLWRIANQHGVSVDQLRQANQLRTDVLQIGQTLNIPNSGGNVSTMARSSYTVSAGDTLWNIASRFGLTVNELRNMNQLQTDVLQIGQVLQVSRSDAGQSGNTQTTNQKTHTVVAGETLWRIATQNGVTVNELKQANQLNSDQLRIGQTIIVPQNSSPSNNTRHQQVASINQEALEWLAKMIYAEARGEPLEGQIAVGAVIMNRVNSSLFPNTVREVLFERSNGVFQFTPVSNGSINTAVPNDVNMEAAIRAANGEDPTNGSLFFYNPAKTGDSWIRTRQVSTTIGNHVFAY